MSGERYPPPELGGAFNPSTERFQAARDWSWSHEDPWSSGGLYSSSYSHQRPPPPPAPHTWRGGCRGGSGRQHWGRKGQWEPELSLHCDVCDRGFKSREKHEEHIAQHIQCSFPGCKFSAHEKLVKIHQRNTHGPGAKKIKLDTDEEIRRWREERRRNYPTLRTVEQKQKLQELKEQRGDVLRTQQFGRFRLPAAPPRVLQRSADGDGDPLAALDSGEHGSDPEEHQQTGDTVAPRSITSALGALMASYSSSGESDGEQHGDSRAPPHREQKHSPSLPDPLLYGAGRLLSQSRPPQCSQKPPARGRSAPFKPAEAFRQRHTLLEMLLAPEIRRERNVVLQCVRFIVQHGFFHSGADAEIGQSERS